MLFIDFIIEIINLDFLQCTHPPSSVECTLPATSTSPAQYLGVGPSTFFLDCVSALKVEDLVKRSPKGGPVGGVLEYIETMDKKGMIELSESLTSALIRCLNAGSARIEAPICCSG